MCLAVPGKVIRIEKDEALGTRTGTVDLNGSRVGVSLELVPEATEGSWVLVHAGFALEVLDEETLRETWEWLATEEQFTNLGDAAASLPKGGQDDG